MGALFCHVFNQISKNKKFLNSVVFTGKILRFFNFAKVNMFSFQVTKVIGPRGSSSVNCVSKTEVTIRQLKVSCQYFI
jgi:hypothetical protein